MQSDNKNSIDQRFTMTKKHHKETLQKAIDDKKVDEILIPFLNEVTKIPDIFTSSSCAGRIMLLSTDELEDKEVSHFHKRYHRTITFDELKKDLQEDTKEMDIWFKVEPFIFHFGTKDYEKAKEVLRFCSEFGLKKAGIITSKDGKYIIEATATQYMALPLKANNKLLVDEDYLHFILDRGNKKLKINYEILDRFEKEFLKKFKIKEIIKEKKK